MKKAIILIITLILIINIASSIELITNTREITLRNNGAEVRIRGNLITEQDFTIQYRDKTISLENTRTFERATITLPYEQPLGIHVEPKILTRPTRRDRWEILNTTIKIERNKITFNTTHFSDYTVGTGKEFGNCLTACLNWINGTSARCIIQTAGVYNVENCTGEDYSIDIKGTDHTSNYWIRGDSISSSFWDTNTADNTMLIGVDSSYRGRGIIKFNQETVNHSYFQGNITIDGLYLYSNLVRDLTGGNNPIFIKRIVDGYNTSNPTFRGDGNGNLWNGTSLHNYTQSYWDKSNTIVAYDYEAIETGKNLTDHAGGDHNATISSQHDLTEWGIYGGYQFLDGTDDHIDIPTVNLGTEYTLEAWLFINEIPASIQYDHIWGYDYTATDQFGGIYLYNNAGQLELEYWQNGVEKYSVDFNAGQDKWFHFVMTCSNTTNRVQMAINGQILTPDINQSLNCNFNTQSEIGYSTVSDSNYGHINVDTTRMYNKTLTPSEIMERRMGYGGMYSPDIDYLNTTEMNYTYDNTGNLNQYTRYEFPTEWFREWQNGTKENNGLSIYSGWDWTVTRRYIRFDGASNANPFFIRVNVTGANATVQRIKRKLKEEGVGIRRLYSINQIAMSRLMHELRRMSPEKTEHIFWNKKLGQARRTFRAEEIHSAYRGGRVQAWKTGIVQNVNYIDCNSLYPYASTKIKFPDLKTERKHWRPLEKWSQEVLLDKIGISRCMITNHKDEIGLLQIRTNRTSYTPKLGKTMIGTWTHIELREAIKH